MNWQINALITINLYARIDLFQTDAPMNVNIICNPLAQTYETFEKKMVTKAEQQMALFSVVY